MADNIDFTEAGGGTHVDTSEDSPLVVSVGNTISTSGNYIHRACACVDNCCDMEGEIDLGEISFNFQYDWVRRPADHPLGLLTTSVNVTELYTFVAWDDLGDPPNCNNLAENEYTAGVRKVKVGDTCYCKTWIVFGVVDTNVGPSTVWNFIGGDPTDAANYTTSSVSHSIGMIFQTTSGVTGETPQTLIAEAGYWDILDCNIYDTTDFGCPQVFHAWDETDKSDVIDCRPSLEVSYVSGSDDFSYTVEFPNAVPTFRVPAAILGTDIYPARPTTNITI